MLKRKLEQLLFKYRWHIAVRKFSGDYLNVDGYAILPNPKHEFRADPFLFEHGGNSWVFFERYRYLVGKGTLACGVLDNELQLRDVREVLVRPYHLSFPQVFSMYGSVWLLPETSESGGLELYRCAAFPDRWVFERTLLQMSGLSDVTLLEYGGKLWLLGAIPTGRRRDEHQLRGWFSNSLFGPWKEHCRSPLMSGLVGSRPAGQSFTVGSDIVRPVQDCSLYYGGGLQFRRVDCLSEDTFQEVVLGTLTNIPCSIGLHTYNRDTRHEVVDVCFRHFSAFEKLEGAVGKSVRYLSSGLGIGQHRPSQYRID